jgi:hypothetical protein
MDLPPESEEVAGFYGAMLETDHAKDATFNKNFFDDWSKVLKKHPPVCSTTMLLKILPADSCTSVTEQQSKCLNAVIFVPCLSTSKKRKPRKRLSALQRRRS